MENVVDMKDSPPAWPPSDRDNSCYAQVTIHVLALLTPKWFVSSPQYGDLSVSKPESCLFNSRLAVSSKQPIQVRGVLEENKAEPGEQRTPRFHAN
jgi:hypothetical protein